MSWSWVLAWVFLVSSLLCRGQRSDSPDLVVISERLLSSTLVTGLLRLPCT